jgi:hypothetical protein
MQGSGDFMHFCILGKWDWVGVRIVFLVGVVL